MIAGIEKEQKNSILMLCASNYNTRLRHVLAELDYSN